MRRRRPRAPKDFDPFTATDKELSRHALPLRPEPQTRPGLAALWERKARRYRDVVSGSLCLDTNPLPPATAALIGVSRDGNFPQPPPRPGPVRDGYFDEISAYTTAGRRSLTSGIAVPMTDSKGNVLATPERLTDSTCKITRR